MITLEPPVETPKSVMDTRPHINGKFIFVGDEKFYIRGVTYGTFRLDRNGNECYDEDVVEQDFAQMAASGFNAVRTYTVPPLWLLDIALRHRLRVMVGLPWEQHVTFLDNEERTRSIEERVRAGVRACAGHQAVLCYAIGNEIPAPIVRWHGRRRIEQHLKNLYRLVKAEDPAGLVTYVNYPSTEYLQLPFLDFVCFNVYLESQEKLEAYLARLQNITDDRPLVIAEIGLDSRRNGEDAQARSVSWQVRTSFARGCAGAFVFAWTDEWFRGGHEIEDWDFGLTDRERRAKPALGAAQSAFADAPFPANLPLPSVSVVVCSYNGSLTIRDCLEGLRKLKYPNYEVIVVDDGSTDATAEIAGEYNFKLISTENRGLSSARNTGMKAATGEIIAYIDDDAYPDPDWLTYLAATFINSTHAAVGGPNIPPPGDGSIADCVANAPGGPIHVLLSDEEAEHIPGCNMAIRKSCLEAIGGFDPQFRVAGDDVDVCWRLQERGWTIGFSPSAVVWHHRRNSLRTYWRQQKGYGKAEALLEKKWTEKYTPLGHLSWSGRLYGKGLTQMLNLQRPRIYQGTWGSALFQSIYQPQCCGVSALPLMPEWYLVIAFILALSALGALWTPLLFLIILLPVVIGAPLLQAGLSASRAAFTSVRGSYAAQMKLRILTAFLHLLQPLARLWGRYRFGLTPWRRPGKGHLTLPKSRRFNIWSEDWKSSEEVLQNVEAMLKEERAIVLRGGDYDSWDLEVRGGLFGTSRLRMTIEEHGAGKQLMRFHAWAKLSVGWMLVAMLFAALSYLAAISEAWVVSAIFATSVLLLTRRAFVDCAAATFSVAHALNEMNERHTSLNQAPSPLSSPISTGDLQATYQQTSSSIGD